MDAHEQRDRLCSLFDVISTTCGARSGALHFGGGALGGVVLFDVGRVCWAAMPGVGRRLTDLVCDVAGVPRGIVEQTYEECRSNGGRVGELLVERKVVSAHQLRALLLRQTAESLVGLAGTDEDPVWIPHRGAGYQPRFTFTVPEVIASAAAQVLGRDGIAARRELAQLVDGYGAGAAFDIDGEPLPVAVGAEVDDYELVRTLGAWIAGVSRRWPGPRPGFVIADTGAGGVAGWQAHGVLFAARFASSSGLARVLAHLMRRT